MASNRQKYNQRHFKRLRAIGSLYNVPKTGQTCSGNGRHSHHNETEQVFQYKRQPNNNSNRNK